MRLTDELKQAIEDDLDQLQWLLGAILDKGGSLDTIPKTPQGERLSARAKPWKRDSTGTRPRRAPPRAHSRRCLPQASALF